MKNVTLLLQDNFPLSTFAIVNDIFKAAGVFWNILMGYPPEPCFRTTTVSGDGQPVTTIDGLEIKVDGALGDTTDTDLIVIVPSITPLKPVTDPEPTISWLQDAHARGVHIASICTGAFLLADTGLLNNKTATTHWGFVSAFQHRYPAVSLKPEKLITDEGDLFCAGGANAGGDLALYLIAKYMGKETAYRTARALLMDPDRKSQAPYMIFRFEKHHDDHRIIEIQTYMEKNVDTPFTIETLAQMAGMSRRTFERRFKTATGDSPGQYLQRIRIEYAKQFLETGGKTFDEITFHVGYQDPSTFRKMFTRTTGLSPNAYREKFRAE